MCYTGNKIYRIGTTEAVGTQATIFKDMTEAKVIETVGPLFTADQKVTGVLVSVSNKK